MGVGGKNDYTYLYFPMFHLPDLKQLAGGGGARGMDGWLHAPSDEPSPLWHSGSIQERPGMNSPPATTPKFWNAVSWLGWLGLAGETPQCMWLHKFIPTQYICTSAGVSCHLQVRAGCILPRERVGSHGVQTTARPGLPDRNIEVIEAGPPEHLPTEYLPTYPMCLSTPVPSRASDK